MARAGLVRVGLLALGVPQMATGVWALFAPRGFYDDFPVASSAWVSTLGPYDAHLVTDVGAGLLALGALVTLAAVFVERRLVQVSLIAWLVFAIPHLAFHAGHTERLGTGDNVANLAVLAIAVLIPLGLLALVAREPT